MKGNTRFNVTEWREFDGPVEISTGRVAAICEVAVPWFLVDEFGQEALAAVGHDIDVRVDTPHILRPKLPKGVRFFVYSPPTPVVRPSGEVFTNPDSMPMVSGSVQAVTAALRSIKLEARALTRERARLAAERKRAAQAEPKADDQAKPKADDQAKPKAEPQAEPQADA